eukprot:CAMPEP_0184659882 /NCGR_PEP_ID=MMETSP0308-20130426/31487_1 /TAXON_ID=38269 /ORGANISM="Gloeochaete witrockiana, Strain SAG 46.84" /LENGTH=404 /DNA_ID=CAMNT_0027100053 /DNA_START=199 /DNA_END=1413 /DNA_ORIENTATION=+
MKMPAAAPIPHSDSKHGLKGRHSPYTYRPRSREARLDTTISCDDLIPELAPTETHETLIARIDALWAERKLLYRTIGRLLDSSEQTNDGLKGESGALRAELAAERSRFSDEKAELKQNWENERSKLEAELANVNNTLELERKAFAEKSQSWGTERNRLKSLLEEARKQRDRVAQEAFKEKKDLMAKTDDIIQEKARLARSLEEVRRERDHLASNPPQTQMSSRMCDSYDREEFLREKFILTTRMGQMQLEIDMRTREQKNIRATLRKVQAENDRFKRDMAALESERKRLDEALVKASEARPVRVCAQCSASLGSCCSEAESLDQEPTANILAKASSSPKKPVNAHMVQELEDIKKKAANETSNNNSSCKAFAPKCKVPPLDTVMEVYCLESDESDEYEPVPLVL